MTGVPAPRIPYLPAAVLRTTLRRAAKPVLRPPVPVRVQRAWLDAFCAGLPAPAGTTATDERLVRASTAYTTADTDPGRAVLLLHGGAFLIGSRRTHGNLAGALAHATGASVHLLDYRLAPEHPYPAALDDAEAAWHALLARGHAPSRLAVVGDSAGGNLALALARRLVDAGGPAPAVLGLLSPWGDLALSSRSVVTEAARDALLNVSWLSAAADAYAAGRRLTEPGLSPLRGDLSGLPPIVVQGGADDVLAGDAARLVDGVRAAGGEIEDTRFPGLWHDFQLQVGVLREADEAVGALGAAIRERTT
ncbi:MAG: alpha/beta hydrolase [Solirubrobacteraceae bacterium]|nr:alpha/beta hydrolase [Solirubrobacteraceae bacterium]